MTIKTREGREVIPVGADIRIAIAFNGESLCRDCAHLADHCGDVSKVFRTSSSGYREIIRCAGYCHVHTYQRYHGEVTR